MLFRKSFLLFFFAMLVHFIAIADNTADSLRLLIAKTYDADTKAELFCQLGEQLKKSNPDSAVVVLKKALVLFHDKESRLAAKTHNKLGEIYLNMGQIKNAIAELKTAASILNKFSDSEELVTSYILLGNIFIQKDNLAEAMENYNKAIPIAEQLSDSIRLSRLYNNSGILNLYLNNNKKALALYSKALELYKKSNDTISIAGTTTNIGSIYVNLGDYKTAENYYIQGWKLFKQAGSIEGEAHALLKIGSLEIKRQQYDSAIVFLNKCISKLDQIETTYSGIRSIFLAEALISKGIALYENNDFEKSIQALEEGMKIAGKDEDLGLISQASEYISKYYSKKQNYKKALEYYKIFKQTSDSIHNEENIKKITRLETKLEYEKNLHNKTLENQALVEKQERSRLYFLLFASILVLGLALLFVLLKLEKNKKKKADLAKENLEQKLEHANKELTTHVMYLLRKNEFILSISEKLKEAKLDAKAENKQRIGELITELERNSEMFSWEEFEVRFQQVYTGFYKNLYERFPNLTKNEIRLCAFAKLNMTIKEIAAITFQSVNSITVARHRLRKKLALKPDESLHNFFSEM